MFFCNSGTEANEACLKFARRYAYTKHQQSTVNSNSNNNNIPHTKTDIVAFNGGFHGRTMGSLSMTYKAAYKTPFAPLLSGITFVDYNDINGVRSAINKNTCAVIVEPVQGEGGVYPAKQEFLSAIRERCDEFDAAMIVDEVQTGLGRSGHLFCYQHFSAIQPDMISLAKPLAGGLPIGAVLIKERLAACMKRKPDNNSYIIYSSAYMILCVSLNIILI